MENDMQKRNEPVFSKKLRAGRRRTYFFDVRPTRSNDYYLTITESKKRYNEDGYDRHKIFLYKEDFNKFLDAMTETINHVKSELLPEYDFDEFSHRDDDENYEPPENKSGSAKQPENSEETSVEAKEETEADSQEDASTEEEGKPEEKPEDDEDLKWE